MVFDRRGIPLMETDEKIRALTYCIQEGATEDALGHALELVERLRAAAGVQENFEELRRQYGTEASLEDYIQWQASLPACSYLGKCNSTRCPKHGQPNFAGTTTPTYRRD